MDPPEAPLLNPHVGEEVRKVTTALVTSRDGARAVGGKDGRKVARDVNTKLALSAQSCCCVWLCSLWTGIVPKYLKPETPGSLRIGIRRHALDQSLAEPRPQGVP